MRKSGTWYHDCQGKNVLSGGNGQHCVKLCGAVEVMAVTKQLIWSEKEKHSNDLGEKRFDVIIVVCSVHGRKLRRAVPQQWPSAFLSLPLAACWISFSCYKMAAAPPEIMSTSTPEGGRMGQRVKWASWVCPFFSGTLKLSQNKLLLSSLGHVVTFRSILPEALRFHHCLSKSDSFSVAEEWPLPEIKASPLVAEKNGHVLEGQRENAH